MLTPDQIRLRLESVNAHESDFAVRHLLGILKEVLPDLATLASGRTHAEADALDRQPTGRV